MAFSPIPGLLASVDEADTHPAGLDVSAGLLMSAHDDQRALHRSRRRWRLAAVAAAAAAIIVVGGLLAFDDDSPGSALGDRTELAMVSDHGATGFIAVAERPWGTSILIDLFDMPRRDGYTMWTVSTSGAWTETANWSWSEDGTCGLLGAAPHAPHEIDRVVVTGRDDRSDELVVGLTS